MSLGGGGGGREQLEQLSQELQAIEAEIESIDEEIGDARKQQTEIDEAIDAIGQLETGSTVQVPLGGGAYVRAEIQDIDEVIVSLGGDYAAEQEQDNAIESLERKRDTLDDRIAELNEEKSELEDESDQLEARAQQMQQQMRQQQMQQLQQSDDDE